MRTAPLTSSLAVWFTISCAGLPATARQPAQPTTPTIPGAPSPAPGDRSSTPDTRRMAAKAVAWLRTQQDMGTGGWAVNPKGPSFPAITALVLMGMLDQPGIDANDPAVAAGLKFILDRQQPDGGIYDKLLPSYNTAISLAALAKIKQPDEPTKAAIRRAQAFLKTLQFGEDAMPRPEGDTARIVNADDPFYGGFGYGTGGRPDLSNTAWALEGLHASGLPDTDSAYQRALVFLQRCQMLEKDSAGKVVNDMPYAKGSRQGGFIYSTSENKDKVGSGESKAVMIEESLTDGTSGNRLRAYGSMTYSGLKSYLYAGLGKNDPRVLAAHDWIRRHYELRWNAGMPGVDEGGSPGQQTDGMYYYYVVFARAMRAWGDDTIVAIRKDGTIDPRDWRRDLAAQLATLQNPDGSFRSVDDRWMENNPVLITAYSLVALGEAEKR